MYAATPDMVALWAKMKPLVEAHVSRPAAALTCSSCSSPAATFFEVNYSLGLCLCLILRSCVSRRRATRSEARRRTARELAAPATPP